ncbi:MAG: ribosome silencing factor [Chloroflexi bacterium]|nr:ribosome silencing factor [Chloroflexota bacterium]
MAAEAASEKQASDIVILDIRSISSFADYFLICSGETERQIRAIEEEIEGVLKKVGVVPYNREGTASSGWVLLDYGDIIVHIFAPFEREYYRLDDLWSAIPPVVRIQ